MDRGRSLKVLVAIITIFIFLPLLVPAGIRVANDFPYISRDFLKFAFSLPQTWNFASAEGLGEYSAGTMWSWPFNLLFGVLGRLGFGFSGVQFIALLLPIFIFGIFSINKFLGYFKIPWQGRVVGGLFYLANTYFLLLVDGGQLSIALAYGVFPIAFIALTDSVTGNLKRKVIAGLLVSGIGILDPRVLFSLFLVFFLFFLYQLVTERKGRRVRLFLSTLLTGLVVLLIFLGLNFYWILPVIMTRADIVPPGYVIETKGLVTLRQAASMFQPHWYENVFGKVSPAPLYFLFIPVIAFSAAIFHRRSRLVWFWIGVALVSIFLTKGVNPPLGETYQWLFDNLPGFYLFRDSTKFFFLTGLSYCFLIAIMAAKIGKFFKFFSILVSLYLLLLVSPVFTGRMTGIFSPAPYEKDYYQLHEILEKDLEFGRVLWLPFRTPLSYSSPSHPSLEAMRIIRERPFAVGVVGTYELFNFIREASLTGEIFNIAGIKYLAYPFPDERRQKLKEEERNYYYAFSSQIEKLPWIEKKIFDFPLNVFQTKKSQDHFFVAPNTFYVVGSDRIYRELAQLKNFDLSQNALIWAEEIPQTRPPSHAKIIFFDKDENDLTVNLIFQKELIFPATNLRPSPDETGWWKRGSIDLVWWRDFLQQKYNLDSIDFDYGGGWAVSEGNLTLEIGSERLKTGNFLLARVMTSGRGGKVEFYQGDNLIGTIDTKVEKPEKVEVRLTGYQEIPDQIFEYDRADFNWFEIGELAMSDEPLTIRTEGEINVVNSLLSISKGDWEEKQKEVIDLINQGKVYQWEKLSLAEKEKLFESHNNAILSHERLSPTHYKVKISDIAFPVTLAFSETFNPLWQMDEKENSYPIYGLINGFKVEKNGEYDLYFLPQRYVFPGLIVSVLSLAAPSGFFLYNFINERKS